MRPYSRLAALTAVVSLAVAAPAAEAAKKGPGSAPTTCTTETFSYDSGGAPGSGVVDDPLFARQWGLDQVNAPEAWAKGARGAGAVIAVVDTGVDLKHPDLDGKLTSAGADFVDAKRNCPAGAQDEEGHGTHVAGIAAAETNNGIGVAGTAPDAKVLPVRVLDEEGSGSFDHVANGIRYAADQGADVINLSLGAPIVLVGPTLFPELVEAIDYAWSRGAVIVAAAGNDSLPLCEHPSDVRNVICVGATDRRELASWYSTFPNDDGDTTGVRAPGGALDPLFCESDEDILSTVWAGASWDCQGRSTTTGRQFMNGYESSAGTSMAAPFVAGVAALLAGQGLTNEQIVERIRATARDPQTGTRGTYDPVYGWGIVDAAAAVG